MDDRARSEAEPMIPSVPGPAPMRLLGARGNLLRFLSDPIGRATALFREYGDTVSVVRAPMHIVNPGPGWGRGELATATGAGVVLTRSVEINREALTSHDRFDTIALSGDLYPVRERVKPRAEAAMRVMTGLFHVNGDEHRRHRRLLMPAFHKTHIERYRDEMVRLTGEMLGRYRVGEARDVHADTTELTLRIATQTLFGEDAGERGMALARTMQKWLLALFSPIHLVTERDIPGLPYARFLDLSVAIDQEIQGIVREKKKGAGPRTDLLSMLVDARDTDGSALTGAELIGHTSSLFAAGHETSTNALSWTLMLLSQHPRAYRDLEDEVDAVLRGAPPTVEDLAKMPLLDAVLKESMRVLPPVPLHPRIVAEHCEIGGHVFPAGSELWLCIFHMHHDQRIFPAPDTFLPRRWETAKPSAFEYNPFSAGPRMCIGAAFATMEMKIVLAMLVQRFRMEMAEPRPRVDGRVAITLAPNGALKMRVRKRTDAPRPAGGVRGSVTKLVALPP